MKDAFGGSFIIRIMIVFFVFFISFMVIAVNFAKTYSVKNGIIDILEHNPRGIDDNSSNLSKAVTDNIEDYLTRVNYGPAFNLGQYDRIKNKRCKNGNAYSDYGVCIQLIESSSSVVNNVYYYRVTTYMSIDTSFFKFGLDIPISGETKTFNSIFD